MAIKDDQGLLAFGDSITNGGGELQWGVALQSWAHWVARALGLPFTSYAVDGARVSDVLAHQIPAHARLNAVAEPRYQLGCLYIGVNDVRALDWDPVAYEERLGFALDHLNGLCERLLTVTVPLDLGRPPAGDKVREANAAIARQAARTGALLLDLRDFRGRGVIMADHVHPTAMGQIAIAERAIAVLAAGGLRARISPRELCTPQYGVLRRLRAAVTYAWRALKGSLRIRLATTAAGLRSR